MKRVTTFRTCLAIAAAAGLALAGCGEDTTDTTGTDTESPGAAATTDAELAALIPEAVADDGVIVVATDASYTPNEFFAEDNTTLIGMDIDLGTALGDVLGLEVRFENAPFDSIPGLESGKFELGMSSFTINRSGFRSSTW